MFITLLLATFIISFVVSLLVVRFFSEPIKKILSRIIADDISMVWHKYLKFATYVVGISSGVRIYQLEKYITGAQFPDTNIVELTTSRWTLEIYRTVIGTLQGIAWMLLVFFIFALLAFVIVKIFESYKSKKAS